MIRVGCEPSGKSPYGDGPLSGYDKQIGVLCCITPALTLVKPLGRKLFKSHSLILLAIAVYGHPKRRVPVTGKKLNLKGEPMSYQFRRNRNLLLFMLSPSCFVCSYCL